MSPVFFADYDEIKGLYYSKLLDYICANNQDQAKRVYRQLVRAGRPLSEFLEQGR
jgi:plasmid stabilization system protein ParE